MATGHTQGKNLKGIRDVGLLLGAVLFLAACSASVLYAYAPYVAPTSGDTSYLRLANQSNMGIGITTFRGAQNCNGQLMFSDPDYASLKSGYLKIEANQPHTYSLAILGSLEICKPMPLIMFTPVSGRYYQLAIAVVDRKCFVRLSSDDTAAFPHPHDEKYTKMEGPELGPVDRCHSPD